MCDRERAVETKRRRQIMEEKSARLVAGSPVAGILISAAAHGWNFVGITYAANMESLSPTDTAISPAVRQPQNRPVSNVEIASVLLAGFEAECYSSEVAEKYGGVKFTQEIMDDILLRAKPVAQLCPALSKREQKKASDEARSIIAKNFDIWGEVVEAIIDGRSRDQIIPILRRVRK
jgi:hypothetical protein